MDLLFRQAQKDDFLPVVQLLQKIWGEEDYIKDIFDNWVTNKKKNNPLVVIDKDSNTLCAIGNMKVIGNYAWLEGLRIHPEYRGNKIASSLTQQLLQSQILQAATTIGYATGAENFPMHSVAKKFGFTKITEQVNFYTKVNQEVNGHLEVKKSSSLTDKDYANFRKKYDHLLVPFSLIPDNPEGKKNFKNMSLYNLHDAYLFHDRMHIEATSKLGIFGLYHPPINSFSAISTYLDAINALAVNVSYEQICISLISQLLPPEVEKDLALKGEVIKIFFYEKKNY